MAVLLRRRPAPPPRQPMRRLPASGGKIRALRASAWRVDPGNRDQTALIRAVQQSWQPIAWRHRKEIGPLRYGCVFLRNIARRMVPYPAANVPGEHLPVPIEDSDLARHAGVCHDALDRLGDHGPLLAALMESFEVAGEGYLISRVDDGDGLAREVWEIRSTSEVRAGEDGKILLRDSPSSTWGGSDTYELQDDDFFARLWMPDPEWRQLADSPVHAAEPILEELSLLLKERRATTVSRLASNGLLLLPDTLSVVRMSPEESADDEDDPFLQMFAEAARIAIQRPGSAEAAIPIVARGPAEALKEVRLLTLDRPATDDLEKWKEGLSALAVTIDLPPEALLGIGDINHWGAWQVDQSTFSHHAEPLVQDECDAITGGYYRRYLLEAGVPSEDVSRLLIWYDPTDAIAKPDMSEAAKAAFDKDALSWEALRRHLGFTEDEAPDEEEQVTHLLLRSRMDPASTSRLLELLDPRLKAPEPPIVGRPLPPGAEPPPDNEPPPEGPPPEQGPPERQGAPGMAARVAELRAGRLAAGDPAEMRARVVGLRQRRTAAARVPDVPDRRTADAERISRRMAERDARLRETLRMAAEQAAKRVLERAGARVVNKLRSKDALAAAAATTKVNDTLLAAALRQHRSGDPEPAVAVLAGSNGAAAPPVWAVPARLGRAVLAALGLAEDQLLDAELAELAALWDAYVTRGQEQALTDAARLVELDPAAAVAMLDGRLRADRQAGWEFLRAALDARLRQALASDPTEAVRTASLVPTGAVRAALAVAGGFLVAHSAGISADTYRPVDPGEPFGQLGTGATVAGYLEANGARLDRYQWQHGAAANPFPPHEALDGYEFEGPDPAVGDLHPGDHAGCSCDLILVWSPPERSAGAEVAE